MLGGRYRVQEQLGVGGMGAVYRALDIETGGDVAIKVLLDTDAKSTQAQRLVREARLCMAIEHPSLVRVFDLEQRDPRWIYIVMEYLPGITVSQHLKTRGAFPPADAAKVTLGLLSALAAIHGHGFFHRDVKGSNILLVHGDPGSCKLLDLGIAKAADPGTSLTAEGMWVGTLTAMAPELFEGVRFDARSEVYSVGLLLYVMLEASAPFPRDHLPTRLEAMMKGPRLPAKRMSPALWNVLCRALSIDPAKRYQTAMAMHDALSQAMQDQEVVMIGAGDGAPTDLMPPIQMVAQAQSGRAQDDFSIDDTDPERGRGQSSFANGSLSRDRDATTQQGFGAGHAENAANSVTVRVALAKGATPSLPVSAPPQASAPFMLAESHTRRDHEPTNTSPVAHRRSGRSSSKLSQSMSTMSRPNKVLLLLLGVVAGCAVSSLLAFVAWHYLL